jgi:hypothetical protein
MLCGIDLKFGTTNVQQRPQQVTPAQRTLARHPRQAPHPCPAQQTKQQGFRLIVTVLAGQQQLIGLSVSNECTVTRIPCRTLKAGTGLNLNVNYL